MFFTCIAQSLHFFQATDSDVHSMLDRTTFKWAFAMVGQGSHPNGFAPFDM